MFIKAQLSGLKLTVTFYVLLRKIAASVHRVVVEVHVSMLDDSFCCLRSHIFGAII